VCDNHRFALYQLHVHYDMHKFGLSNRIIPLWNSLPDYVVSSPTTNTFKARLDKFWENQDVRYNWKADRPILFTGSRTRSKVELIIFLKYFFDFHGISEFVLYNELDIEVYDLRPSNLHYYYYYYYYY